METGSQSTYCVVVLLWSQQYIVGPPGDAQYIAGVLGSPTSTSIDNHPSLQKELQLLQKHFLMKQTAQKIPGKVISERGKETDGSPASQAHAYQPKELAEAFFIVDNAADRHKCKACGQWKHQKLKSGYANLAKHVEQKHSDGLDDTMVAFIRAKGEAVGKDVGTISRFFVVPKTSDKGKWIFSWIDWVIVLGNSQ